MSNPLLSDDRLPRFSEIRAEHVEPAIDEVLNEYRELVESLCAHPERASWQSVIEPLQTMDNRLDKAWSPVSHLKAVMDSDALRDAYNACLPKLSAFGTEMGQNAALYKLYHTISENDELTPQRRRVIDNALKDFHLSGVDLETDAKEEFKQNSQRLSELTSRFSDNVLDATQGWYRHITDIAELPGLPESALGLTRQLAEQRELDGWVITLDFPSFHPVMTYCDNRELRREVYEAFVTRASELGPNAGKWDNSPIMDEILDLRYRQAQLLGFNSYAERSLAKKMARSTDEVLHFLNDLAQRSKPQAEAEFNELRAFAADNYDHADMEPWDVSYYSEKLRLSRYDISQETLRPYFPDDRVVNGMFEVVQRLYDITITPIDNVDAWHPDIRFYRITDQQGQMRGEFYLDLYARQNKRGGAWMDGCVNRMVQDEQTQTPVAFLVCNFSPPVGDQPALLTHDEVETLFHEFGHGLHHMLTQIDYPEISGINGVAWDAVELPSQFHENWCWEAESLSLISAHVDTGTPLPDDLFQRMKAAKNFQSAMQMVRQLEFSLFDFRIHNEYQPERGARIYEILDEVRSQVSVVPVSPNNRFAHGFSHIFAGGYAAGYYSYKWAEVLSADAFSLFEERGIFDKVTGLQFMHTILENGGSEDAMTLFKQFRGREPQIDALLRHSGIAA